MVICHTSSDISKFKALTLSSSCFVLVAPITVDVTNGRLYTQARAIGVNGREIESASCLYLIDYTHTFELRIHVHGRLLLPIYLRTASIAGGETYLCMYPTYCRILASGSTSLGSRYLPVRAPPARGEYARRPWHEKQKNSLFGIVLVCAES